MAKEPFQEGTEAHYRDGRYYDHRYRQRRHDVQHYVELARRSGGPVLELGVGTGRVAMAIAATGVEVVGVDSMPPMLERARAQLETKPKRLQRLVTLTEGDMREVRLGRRFPLVIAPFNVFMHLYTRRDVEHALATVSTHLENRGRLGFDVLMPDARALSRDPSRIYKCRPIRHPVDGRRYDYREAFYYDPVNQVQLVNTILEDRDSPGNVQLSQLNHRQFFPQELEALLHYNGFRILEHRGDFEGRKIHPLAESQVVVAEHHLGPGVAVDRLGRVT
ncbi:MAG: class I SAM-dependent methyltransferase [Myxococcales bacterium]|nr:class I SAM-dependent methyltransferase [Myxococcales bacterium]MDD9968944.1 class I SAM-dependent methyltransferase [Myxococcales bacterium]